MRRTASTEGKPLVHNALKRVIAETNDPGPDAFEEAVESVPTILPIDQLLVAHLAKQSNVHNAAKNRREAEKLAVGRFERVNTRFDQRLQRRRHGRIGILGQHFQQLGDEQWVAIGALYYIANRRCAQIGLAEQYPGAANPFPWMSELIDLKKEKNFFETRVTEYQTGGALSWD